MVVGVRPGGDGFVLLSSTKPSGRLVVLVASRHLFSPITVAAAMWFDRSSWAVSGDDGGAGWSGCDLHITLYGWGKMGGGGSASVMRGWA